MKINLKIDCTPEEARRFFGLPDVKPMQDRLLSEMEKRLGEGISAMDVESLLRTWLPLGLQGWEEMQRRFWNQFAAGTGQDTARDAGRNDGDD